MNGVSRFLSRRDKHHEKRQSKHARSKVRPPSFLSSTSSLHALCSVDGVADQCSLRRPRRRLNSIHCLYHKLPSILQPTSPDSFLFLRKKPPCADLSSFYVQVSTIDSSDHLTLQSRQPVPTDLYTVFSNEELKISEKDDERKVRIYSPCSHLQRDHGQILGKRQGCLSSFGTPSVSVRSSDSIEHEQFP